jgi:hypothetical protein
VIAVPGRHLPPDHSAGDEATIGGYRAVHGRPAAFEGSDGIAYSVEVMVDDTGENTTPFAAYLLFLKWRRIGTPGVESHLESAYMASAATESAARAAVDAMSLQRAKETLDALILERNAGARKWWDAMRDDPE